MMKSICAFLVCSLIMISIGSGCSSQRLSGNKPTKNYSPEALGFSEEQFSELFGKLDHLIDEFSDGKTEDIIESFKEKFDKISAIDKVDFALSLADDMTIACMFGLEDRNALAIAGAVVKEYPHPILLNNYGAMLAETSPKDALFLIMQAIGQEPDNPVFLTNLANVYIQTNNFDDAQNCAKMALEASPGYGPAYQVLTTAHLKNGDSILAVETMVKSAVNCFNSISIHQFESFLEEVGKLDPETDEYPLKEEFLKELYLAAKENVDVVSEEMDAPEAQLRIKDFPSLGDVDLGQAYDYLYEEQQKISQQSFRASRDYYHYQNAIDDYLYDSEPGERPVYPIKNNLRQIYAYKVLQSYYTFKLEKLRIPYQKEFDKIQEEASERILKISDEDSQRTSDKSGNVNDYAMGGTGVSPERAMQMQKEAVEKYKKMLTQQKQVLLSFSSEVVSLSKNCYEETKQTLEEYWLRTGGIIKYVADEDIFNQMVFERNLPIYDYVMVPLDNMLSWSGEFINLQVGMIVGDELENIYGNSYGNDGGQAIENGDDLVPDIEKQAITIFPEKGDLPEIGMELEFFGCSISLQTDGERLKVGIDTPFFTSEISKNLLYEKPSHGGYFESYTAYGVKVQGKTDWFLNNKKVKDAIGKGGKVLGGIGFSNSAFEGNYYERDCDNTIKDRGRIYIREVGGEIGDFGRSEKAVVKKSSVTGLAIKSKSVKYKFSFASVSVG